METEIVCWKKIITVFHREIIYGDLKWIRRVRDLMEGLRDDG
jgi:hypothetical protein